MKTAPGSILVTGGAGFIGSHLCARLVAEGRNVICLDNFYSGRESNVESLKGEPNFKLMNHDVTAPFYMLHIDEIFHMACPASPVVYQLNPIKTLKTNVMGTLNALGLAKRNRCKILIASTSEVYGDPTVHPQTEEYTGNVSCVGPRSCYDEGKRAAEALCMDYHRFHGVDTRIARIFNTYGPRMRHDDGRVISNMIVQALKNEKLSVYGSGEQTRSFCYVDDLIDGLIALMRSDVHDPVNLGNPNEITIAALAHHITTLQGNPGHDELEYRRLPTDDPHRRQPDITRAKSLLNWEPRVTLAEGLKKTIVDFAARKHTQPDNFHPAHQQEAVLLSVKESPC